MVEIVQISDLHYGSEFQEDYFNNILSYLKEKKPDAVVCSGDLVHKGRYVQYQKFVPYLQKLKDIGIPLLCIPGNHDVKNNGLVFFERFIGPRRSKIELDEKDTMIVGVCSAKDDISEGEITDEQLEWLARQFSANLENRVVALHHHVIPVPYSGRKHTTLVDAGEFIEFTQLFGIDLVLIGHKHIPHANVIGPTTFLYCGTSTSKKVRADESASFNHIILEEGDLDVSIINSETLEESILLSRKEGHTKYVRPRKSRIEHLINSKIFRD